MKNTNIGEQPVNNDAGKTQYRFVSATGPIPCRMINDYIFRIVLQTNEEALKNLIGAILHLEEGTVTSVTVMNPIDPGKSVTDKEIRMDLRVDVRMETGKRSTLNIEMQVRNPGNWPDRSMIYLARESDTLKHGDDYQLVRPVYQIGIMDYTQFPEEPEFCATYHMRNDRSGTLYNDKFAIIVLSLEQIERATEDDRRYGLDRWAKLFKANTWEEVKMITEGNNALTSAAESLYLSNEDYNVWKVAREREDFLREQAYKDRLIETQRQELEQKDKELDQKDKELDQKDKELDQKDKEIAQLKAQLAAKA